ncbi:hypothetical protein K458DRAFT_400942 [Lentithecium fluviatile CBS 122367]|uniref:Cupredoxin n=1 Tax=Lentithecium fluviatile CBS 122367 TaxID=1168545 RepID=A0A6G1JFA8_9PLEO|nr:hypothetical protein K458DRAFT_400942 [Lentithecium fluviatile CBS 122367]
MSLITSVGSSGASATGSAASSVTSAAASITSTPNSAPSSTGSASSSSSSSSRGQQVHTVKAGAGGFKFDPPSLEDVAKGDIVTFEFYPPDHSVARAEYMSPCVPYEYTGKDKVGFWSDTQWVDSVDDITHWNLTINSTEPIFYYCAAPGSCIDHQMVGVINPNSSQSLDAQSQAAKDSTFMVKPGDPIPKEGSATLSATGLSSTATSAPTSNTESHGVHLSGGAIAGIVVGAVAFLALCAALFFYVGRTKSLKEMMHRKDATVVRTGQEEAGPGWNGSQHPGSPGFPPQPFSPAHSHAEFYTGGGATLPPYGQHNATDSHPSGWMSPTQTQQQMAEVKYEQEQPVHEMASPQQNAFTAELEAPGNKPR